MNTLDWGLKLTHSSIKSQSIWSIKIFSGCRYSSRLKIVNHNLWLLEFHAVHCRIINWFHCLHVECWEGPSIIKFRLFPYLFNFRGLRMNTSCGGNGVSNGLRRTDFEKRYVVPNLRYFLFWNGNDVIILSNSVYWIPCLWWFYGRPESELLLDNWVTVLFDLLFWNWNVLLKFLRF